MPVLLDDPDYEAPEDDPLHRAVSNDDVEKVKTWIVERTAEERGRFFELAASRGSMKVARWFIEHGGGDVHSALRDAVTSGRVEMLELFLASGARVTAANSQSLFSAPQTPAMLAALVKHGLAPTTKSYDRTALMVVCGTGDLASARTLLDGGADVNARSKEGTALTLAEGNGHRVLVDFLLERGAKPEGRVVVPDAERDALFAAASERPREASRRRAWGEWLLSHGYRAAAARELQAVKVLPHGDSLPHPDPLPEGEGTVLHGAQWTFIPFDDEVLERVSTFIDDSRFPRAWVTDGTRTLPLAIVLGSPCTRCDEKCEVTCSECNGTGFAESYLTGRTHPCAPRKLCFHCKGTKFTVYSQHFGKGSCPHPSIHREADVGTFTFVRCTACGLSAIDYPYKHTTEATVVWDFACGVCGYFECRCSVVANSASPPDQEKK